MVNIDIIYNQPLTQIQGINYVNNSFVEGNKYFQERGMTLRNIYSSTEVFNCREKKCLDLIGSNINDSGYKRERKIRSVLKKIFSSNTLIGALTKFYFNNYRPSKIVVNNYCNSQNNPQCILFQDIFSAYFYFRKNNNPKDIKTLLILHCSESTFEQESMLMPVLYEKRWFKKYLKQVQEYVFSNIGKVIYLSQRAVDHSSTPIDKKTYIFNGEEDIQGHNCVINNGVINCVSVASMAWRKGHEFVLEAMTKLPEDVLHKIKYHMIGAGPQMQELKDFVAANKLEDYVIFYGNRNDVPELLKGMDVFILPSKSEGLPMSIIEALRQGMYLVATDTGAIPEMIAPGCGELVERDANQIAECLTRIVKDGVVTMEVKQKAREHYLGNFTLKNMIYKYCDVLESL